MYTDYLYANVDLEGEIRGSSFSNRFWQYLAFFIGSDEQVLLTEPPPDFYMEHLQKLLPQQELSFQLFTEELKGRLLTWSPSLSCQTLAKSSSLDYETPPWALIRSLQDKSFLYRSGWVEHSFVLVEEKEELHRSLQGPYPLIVKETKSSAGRGHRILQDREQAEQALPFLIRSLELGNLIVEAFVERVLDWSSQYYVHRSGEIEYLGSCRLENRSSGAFSEVHVAKKDLFGGFFSFVEEHKQIAKAFLEILPPAFYGHIGIDAMLYKKGKKLFLRPLLELNCRKTMGWFALHLHKKNVHLDALSLCLGKRGSEGLLPSSLPSPGERPDRKFSPSAQRQLCPQQLFMKI